MITSSRSYLTAGVAAIGASAIALTSVQPLPTHVALPPQRAAATMPVELAAAIDPLTPVIDLSKAALADIGTLIDQWSAGLYVDGVIPMPPNTGTSLITGNGNLGFTTGGYESGVALPILRQMIANQISYLGQLPDISGIVKQVTSNVGNSLKAPFKPGVEQPGRLPGATLSLLGVFNFNQNVSAQPLINLGPLGTLSQRDVGAALPFLAGAEAYAKLEPILKMATTPISGVLLGAIGPVLGPALALVDSVKAILASIKGGDLPGAINELINIPTTMVGAALIGGPTLDLTKLVKGLLPDTVQSLGIRMGGLLSPGGVAFDGIAADATAASITINDPGLPIGPIGSLARLANYVAKSIQPPQAQSSAARQAAPRSAKPAASLTEVTAPQEVTPGSSNEAPAPKRQSRRAGAGTGAGDSAPKAAAAQRARRAG